MPFPISYDLLGLPLEASSRLVVWGHGWGQNRSAFTDFMRPFLGSASHLALDFPGFGASPLPPLDWDTAAYADALAECLRPLCAGKKLIYVGHSFGGRVGIQLAARHPDLVDALFIVSGAGLQRKRGFLGGIRVGVRVRFFKLMKALTRLRGGDLDALRARFGSADYRNAGALRPLFVRVVAEDLSDVARKVTCPVRLIYGTRDTETPPEFGKRFEKLMPHAKLFLLEGQDHYSVLGAGRTLVQKRFADFMGSL